MEGGSGRPLFQLGLSLFLIIYTASILRRLPRYVRHSVFGPTRCVQKIVKSNSYHMFSINMLLQCNLCQSICCEGQGQGRNQLQRWRVEAIFALSSKSSSLSLFALATSFSLPPSFFLSFIPGLSHTTTQTAASSHLLTDADVGGGCGGCAAGYYDTNNCATVHILVSIPLIRCTHQLAR